MKDRRVIIERPRKGGKTLEALEAERGYWKERVATLEYERDQYREALAAFLDEAALLHFIAELKRNTGIMDPERGGILNYLRQAGDEPTPAFIITTDDNLSEADTEKLLADLEINPRPGPCGSPSPNLFLGVPADPPCIRTAGHDGGHYSRNGTTWRLNEPSAGCARCGSPDHRLDDCPDYDPDDDYHGSYE